MAPSTQHQPRFHLSEQSECAGISIESDPARAEASLSLSLSLSPLRNSFPLELLQQPWTFFATSPAYSHDDALHKFPLNTATTPGPQRFQRVTGRNSEETKPPRLFFVISRRIARHGPGAWLPVV
eukprot:363625-Chlamydomonas_euryale.AAC.3